MHQPNGAQENGAQENGGVSFWASAIVLATGIFWGVYWVPVRAIAEGGLDGAWGTGAITLAALAGREDADTLLRTLRQQMKVTVVESNL